MTEPLRWYDDKTGQYVIAASDFDAATTCPSCGYRADHPWKHATDCPAADAARKASRGSGLDVPGAFEWCCAYDWNNGTFNTTYECIGRTSLPEPRWQRIRAMATSGPDPMSTETRTDAQLRLDQIRRWTDYWATTDKPEWVRDMVRTWIAQDEAEDAAALTMSTETRDALREALAEALPEVLTKYDSDIVVAAGTALDAVHRSIVQAVLAHPAMVAALRATDVPPERFDWTWWHYADDCPASPARATDVPVAEGPVVCAMGLEGCDGTSPHHRATLERRIQRLPRFGIDVENVSRPLTPSPYGLLLRRDDVLAALRATDVPVAEGLDEATFLAGLDSPNHSPESRQAWVRLFFRDMQRAALTASEPDGGEGA